MRKVTIRIDASAQYWKTKMNYWKIEGDRLYVSRRNSKYNPWILWVNGGDLIYTIRDLPTENKLPCAPF